MRDKLNTFFAIFAKHKQFFNVRGPTSYIDSFIEKHKRLLSPTALFVGFVFDNFTLTRIDLLYDNLVLFIYLLVAGGGITMMQLYKNEVLRGNFVDTFAPWLPILIQFAFGGLFSGYFIFYMRSAAVSASWVFILLILGLLIGNEFFRKKYTQFVFQLSIFYLCVFSFVIFFVPVFVGSLGAGIFLLSGGVSLLVIGALYLFFAKVTPHDIQRYGKSIVYSIASIYIVMNGLYFANIIPPIPLSLKDIGVYYSVEQNEEGDYKVIEENRNWYDLDGLFGSKIYHTFASPVYVYSSVFAPTNLDTKIIHVWEYYDKVLKEWVVVNEIEFPIHGGRDGGYRGFSFKKSIFAGKWRVSVTTLRGQLIGRKSFTVIDSAGVSNLITKVL